MRPAVLISLTLVAAAPLCACTSINEAVHGPQMAPMGYPSALVPTGQQVLPIGASGREPLPQPASANSLWRVGARAFFNDQRAGKVGDILTVLININDSAKTTNETTSGRTSTVTAGIPHLLGLESALGKILPSGFDPANALSTNSKTTNDGTGAINRQE